MDSQKPIRVNPIVCVLILPVVVATHLAHTAEQCLFYRQVKYLIDCMTGKTAPP